MTDVTPQQKADRLAAALKENLKRRKAQARGRKAAAPSSPKEAGPPGAEAPDGDKPSE